MPQVEERLVKALKRLKHQIATNAGLQGRFMQLVKQAGKDREARRSHFPAVPPLTGRPSSLPRRFRVSSLTSFRDQIPLSLAPSLPRSLAPPP